MPDQLSSTRLHCDRCLRPQSHCLCGYVSTVSNRTRVLVLQHPEEHKHALNTGRLAVLGLERAELLVGEHFPQLVDMLPAFTSAFLLFPGEFAQPPQPLACDVANGSVLLIVPDGTWRKARKILYANPVLNTLPRLSLEAGAPSRYRLRKTSVPAAVSTIEAIARTLAALEPEQDFNPILRPFDALIEQQIQAMGSDVYRRHHQPG
ncbi:tRNA-uridine aminocarboxypropyltransferase [Pollutimonas bauzanensis]|uniref:tRNA-uridine aminocarboxypropyltransferase n=1 Tax=Pollutimonas bauzanensis TaxID=658167 RepID=UPI00333F7D0C